MKPTPTPASPEIDRLARATSFGFLVVLFVVAAPGVWNAVRMPIHGKIFVDMLGSADKLPGLTKLLLDCQAFLPWLGLTIPLAGLVVFLVLRPARAIVPLAITIGAAFLFSAILSVGLQAPWQKIISGMTSMS